MGHIVVDTDTMDPIIASYFRTHFSPSPLSRPTNVPTTLSEKQSRRISPCRLSSSENSQDRGRSTARLGSHRNAQKTIIFKSSDQDHLAAEPQITTPTSSASNKVFAHPRNSRSSSPSQQYSLLPPTEAPNRPLPPSPPQLHFPGPAAWQRQYAGIYGLSSTAARSAFSASTESLVADDHSEHEDEGYDGSGEEDIDEDASEQLLYEDLAFPSPPSSASTPAMPLTPVKQPADDYFSTAIAGSADHSDPTLPSQFMEKAQLALLTRAITFSRTQSQSPVRSQHSSKED